MPYAGNLWGYLSVDSTGLLGTNPTLTVDATAEVQSFTCSGVGSFTIGFGGVTSASIASTSTASQLQVRIVSFALLLCASTAYSSVWCCIVVFKLSSDRLLLLLVSLYLPLLIRAHLLAHFVPTLAVLFCRPS